MIAFSFDYITFNRCISLLFSTLTNAVRRQVSPLHAALVAYAEERKYNTLINPVGFHLSHRICYIEYVIFKVHKAFCQGLGKI